MLWLLLACHSGNDSAPVNDDSDLDSSPTTDTEDSSVTTDPCAGDTVTVEILDPASDLSLNPGESVNYAGTATSSTGSPLTYTWTLDGSPISQDLTGTWTASAAGTFALIFQAQDGCGQQASASRSLIVSSAIRTVYGTDQGVPSGIWYGLSATDGTVWAASDKGVLHLDPASSSRLYTLSDGLLMTASTSVLHHSDGSLWVGHAATYNQEGEVFSVATDGSLSLLKVIDYTESTEITSVYRLREQPFGVGIHDVWMGTNEGACVYDSDLGMFQEHAHPTHPHLKSQGLAFTPDGHVWNGDEYQLSRWNYSNDGDLNPAADLAEYWVPYQALAGTPIEIMDLDADGWTLWVVSSLYGVAKVEVSASIGASVTSVLGAPFPMTANAVRVDGVGHVWIGANTGLFVFDPATKKLATYDLGVADPAVSQLTVDPSTTPPTVWAATPGALVQIQGLPDGLPWQDTLVP